MAITWGSVVNDYGRIGIEIYSSHSDNSTTVTADIWFWSKYSVSDVNNTLYYDWDATSASTSQGSVSISTTVDTGSGWSTSNQKKLKSYTKTYARGSTSVSHNCASKLINIEAVNGTMTVSTSFTIPALSSYIITYNANGGQDAPSYQVKNANSSITLSTKAPTRNGYNFAGWGTSRNTTTVSYKPGATYNGNANLALYAVWSLANKDIYIYPNSNKIEAVKLIEDSNSPGFYSGGIIHANEFVENANGLYLGKSMKAVTFYER